MSMPTMKVPKLNYRIIVFYGATLVWWSILVASAASLLWTHILPSTVFLDFLLIWVLLVVVSAFPVRLLLELTARTDSRMEPEHFFVGWLLPPLFLAGVWVVLWFLNLLWYPLRAGR